MKYPTAYCPIDKTRLPDLVESTADERTYHCLKCNNYWHYHYVKRHYGPGVRPKMVLIYVRNDFGKHFEIDEFGIPREDSYDPLSHI